MEKTVVIYKSKYGASQQYATWIGEALNCKVYSIDDIKKKDLLKYENIIYGAGVQAGGIKEMDKIIKWLKGDLKLARMVEKGTLSNEDAKKSGMRKFRLIIFAVGINVMLPEPRMQLREINFDKDYLKTLTCFYLPGAYHPEKVKGIDKQIMKVVKNMMSGKSPDQITDSDRELLSYFDRGCDLIKKEYIQPLVDEILKKEP